jgi:hypothetical protein
MQRTSAPHLIGFPCTCHVFVFQNIVVVSYEPLASNVLSGEKSSEQIEWEWALMGFVRDSPSPFQVMSSPPVSPLARNCPSLDT